MKALILDIGNTRAKLFRWDGSHQKAQMGKGHPPLLQEMGAWDTPTSPDEVAGFTAELVHLRAESSGQKLVVTSVVPALVPALSAPDGSLIVVDHHLQMPFDIEVEDPAAVGADRYCNVAAAVCAGLDSALVVDVGTATTFDLLVEGRFIGGLIAPGPAFALDRLADHAARLQEVPFEPAPLEAGASTRDAMIRGAWHVGLGGINSCISGLLQRYGELPVLVTGGLGGHLAASGRHRDPHLTLRGAAFLAGLAVDS